jgi:ABC-type siderophore export system fused ATPase/permease subunit
MSRILAVIEAAVESTGHRKRFVPAESHLERKRVHIFRIFGEVAADQAPGFRGCFHEPRLAGRAK